VDRARGRSAGRYTTSDFNANDDIHIEAYEDGKLKAEDSDDGMALVQY
jgi:hypothetical protein